MKKTLKSEEKILKVLSILLDDLKSKYKVTEEEILDQVKGRASVRIPVSLFTIKQARPLELLCKYLKEEFDLNYTQVAKLLNRDYRTIWTTSRNASKKLEAGLDSKGSEHQLPVEIFQNRKLSVLEAAVLYLRDQKELKLIQIAILLDRDQRNIWSLYNRAKNKVKK